MKSTIITVSCCLTIWLALIFSGCLDDVVSPVGGVPANCPPTTLHRGEATFYTFADGSGSCLFPPTPTDLMVAAMNDSQYSGSRVCGSCVGVRGPLDSIVVRIVDRCPGCGSGDLDLSPQAFARLADTTLGRIPISWRVVPCPTVNPIIYHFKDGSNQWWTAVQVRNHRHPILKFEYKTSAGIFKTVDRMEWNYFVETSGMGPGPYTFRVTDIFGHQLVDSGIVHIENGDVAGRAQFPPCN